MKQSLSATPFIGQEKATKEDTNEQSLNEESDSVPPPREDTQATAVEGEKDVRDARIAPVTAPFILTEVVITQYSIVVVTLPATSIAAASPPAALEIVIFLKAQETVTLNAGPAAALLVMFTTL
jgi:phage tail sheath protein FI